MRTLLSLVFLLLSLTALYVAAPAQPASAAPIYCVIVYDQHGNVIDEVCVPGPF